MDLREETEFYVSCNPPLLPKGVGEVKASIVEALGERLAEILYEPELAAFKLVSSLDDRDAIFQYVQDLLTTVLNKDTDLVRETTSYADGKGRRGDIDIVSPGRFVPWAAYDEDNEANLALYNDHRYPLDLESCSDQTVWRGLEDYDGWTFGRLVREAADLWRGRNVPASLRGHGKRFSCTFLCNKAETLVYIGTGQALCGPAYVQGAARALQNLVDLLAPGHPRVRHLVMYEDQKNPKLAFRSFSHVGFDHNTYLLQGAAETYPEVMRAATLRTLRADWDHSNRPLLPDFRRYPLADKAKPDVNDTFKIFDDYRPRIGAGKVLAVEKLTGDEVMDDAVQLEGMYEPGENWNWSSVDIKKWRRGVDGDNSDVNHGALSESSSIQAMHLLDSSPPDGFISAHFVPLQHPLMPSLISDGTSDITPPTSATDLDVAEFGSTLEDLDLIEFEDPAQEHVLDQHGASDENQMPADIRELGMAFGRLKLRDMILDKQRVDDSKQKTLKAAKDLDKPDSRPGVPQSVSPSKPNELRDWKGKFWDIMKSELRYLCDVLRMTPGKVGLELRFGRILLCNFNNLEIHDGTVSSKTARSAEGTGKYLQDCYPNGEVDLGFSSVLSTCDADATFISRIKPHGLGEWQTSDRGRRMYYDLICRLKSEEKKSFTISIDAETFAWEVKAASNDLASVLVHCPLSAWDLKVAAVHHSSPKEVKQWREFVKETAASLRVSTTKEKGLLLELVEMDSSTATIEEIRMRSVADYGNRAFPGSIMSITLTKLMSLQRKSNGLNGPSKQYQILARPRKPVHKTGKPNQWIETTMQSRCARKLFTANDNGLLEFGNYASWGNSEAMEAPGGALDELCWPALGMISEMDGCGLWNDNDQAPQPLTREQEETKAEQAQAKAKAAANKPAYEFW